MSEDIIKLLIIDDDAIDRMTIQRSLAKTKIAVSIDMAERGKLGLDLLDQNQYDCIFIDYILPDTDGVSLLKQIRAQGIETPIVIVTSQGDERIAIDAIRSGASDYISKNLLTPDGISHSLRSAIKLYEIDKNRKATEAALLRSENRLKEAQKLAKLGNWELNINTKEIILSNEVYNIFELNTDLNFNYDLFSTFVHPDDRVARQTTLDRALKNKLPYQSDYRIITTTGKTKYVTTHGTPLFHNNGELTAVVGTIQDISDRISTRNALKESEERYLMLIETMNEGVIHVDNNHMILFANKRICEMMGYTKEEVIGKSMMMFIPDERNRKILEAKNDLRQKKISDQYEIELMRKNGETLYFLVGASALLNPAGEVVGSLGTLTNISERRKIEEALSSSEKLLRTLFENAQGFICTHRLDGTILSINKAGAEIVGIPILMLLEKNLLNFIEPDKTESFKSYLETINVEKQATGIFPFINAQDGSKHYLLYQNVLYQERDKESYVIVTAQDITERINFEKELTKAKLIAEKSVKVKEQFLANMSHEIRTPMNGIIGLTSVLQKMVIDEEQKSFLQAIQASADKLLVIINDILDFSKIEAGKIDFEETDFNPKMLLRESIKLFQLQALERNNTLKKVVDQNVPEVIKGDPGKLTQVLNNLIGNAIKFTQKGQITVKANLISENEENIWLQFKVQDTGIGIPEEKINHVFESFTQASSDTSRKYGGTGLGLTISKQFIQLQGGSISVKSKLNEGSIFTFRLPFRKSTATVPTPVITSNNSIVHPAELGCLRLLLAEDNEINQLLVKKIMNDWGFELDIAENGLKALELFNQNNYHLILMDMQMPEMDGYEATDYIRKSKSPKSKIPIIALTAHASLGEVEKCTKAGTDAYISKPFKAEVLLQEIATLIRNNPDFTPNISDTEKSLAQNKVINLNYLREMANGDASFIEEIINMFILQTPDNIANLLTLAQENKWLEVKAIAHKMKSSIVLIGNKELENICINLQQYARSPSSIELIPSLIFRAKTLCEKAIEELKLELKTFTK